MIPLTREESNFIRNKQHVTYAKKGFIWIKIIKKIIDDKNYINKRKVKDHCYYTGKFRGAAHSK